MKNLLSPYPAVIEIPIAWGDMDAFQHVNNIMYFQYFEGARMAYFEKLNYMEHKDQTGIGPILASTQCKFKIPLSYPDTISAATRVSRVLQDRFLMEYIIVSHRYKKIAAEGDGWIVSFDYHNGTKIPIPDAIRKCILEIEKG